MVQKLKENLIKITHNVNKHFIESQTHIVLKSLIMGHRFYFLLFLGLIASLILCATIGGSIQWFLLSKKQNQSFKQSLKSESFIQKKHLIQKITNLKNEIEKAKQALVPDSPSLDFMVSQPLKPSGHFISKSVMDKAFKELSLSLPVDLQAKNQTMVLKKPVKFQNRLISLKRLLPDKLFIDESHFIKIKNQSFVMIFYSPQQNNITAVFLKPQFFKETQKTKASSFTTLNKNQDIFFYNHKKTLEHNSLKALISSFFNNPKPKYINIHSKTKARQSIYYMQSLKTSNLILLSKKTKSLSFFETLFLKNNIFIIYIFTLIVFLGFILGLVLHKVFLLIDSYLFLKKAFVSFAKIGSFPLWENKNPLLFFYKNRKMILKQESPKEDQKEDKKTYQLQDILKEELKKVQSRYPQLSIHEDFQTDIKMFGFERFLRTILHELLSNAVEAMGAVKHQKIDVSIKEEQNFLVLSIRDYGTGISDTKKAFQIYHSTKSQLGVGLNLVQSIVHANGGEITLEKLKKPGTRVSIRLPFSCFIKN